MSLCKIRSRCLAVPAMLCLEDLLCIPYLQLIDITLSFESTLDVDYSAFHIVHPCLRRGSICVWYLITIAVVTR